MALMCGGPTRADGLPTYARCIGCGGPIAKSKPPGSGKWERGPDTHNTMKRSGIPWKCRETESGKHEPRDGSFW